MTKEERSKRMQEIVDRAYEHTKKFVKAEIAQAKRERLAQMDQQVKTLVHQWYSDGRSRETIIEFLEGDGWSTDYATRMTDEGIAEMQDTCKESWSEWYARYKDENPQDDFPSDWEVQ